jgi:hypothetical protein
MQSWSIKPSVACSGRVELCGLDFVGGYRYFDGLRFFDERLDLERLRQALTLTVTRYPLLAGSIVEEAGRVFIDLDGPGVSFAVEERAEPCPMFGPGILQINQPSLFLPKPMLPAMPSASRTRAFGQPLLLLKVTRFSDGRYALGGTTCHVVGDATSTGMWFEDCYRYYQRTDPGPAPEFSRQTVTGLGMADACEPSAKSGLAVGQLPLEVIRTAFFDARYTCVSVSGAQRAILQSLAASSDAGITVNDLLHALLMKSFAQVLPAAQEQVAVDLAYDIRRIRDFAMPANYCGNTVLHRWLRVPRTEVLRLSALDLGLHIRAFGKADSASARQDIGFLEGEYRAGRVNEVGILTNVQPPLGPGSLIINNMTASPNTQVTFGGLALWTDLAINEPLPIRMAMMYPDLNGGLAIILILSPEQLAPFPVAWTRALEELTNGHPPRMH